MWLNNVVFVFVLLFSLFHINNADNQKGRLNIFNTSDITLKYFLNGNERVNIKLYYESLCPYCMTFYKDQLAPIIQKMNQYLNVLTFPYGNAKTIKYKRKVTFKCQHGPAECYGNMLHACAIDSLQNTTAAILFNSCLMDQYNRSGSNDAAAEMCSIKLSVNSEPITNCAKGPRGKKLLQYYGEESKKANVTYVPYILVNDELSSSDNFIADVCSKFVNPPPICTST